MINVDKKTKIRRWDRLPICVPMFVRWMDKRRRKFQVFATALNVSAGGALLVMPRQPPLGATVELEIPCSPVASEISLGSAVHHLVAEVVRVEDRQNAYLVAANFLVPIPFISRECGIGVGARTSTALDESEFC